MAGLWARSFGRLFRSQNTAGTWYVRYPENAFQTDEPITLMDPRASSAVYTCRSIIAQEIARLELHHVLTHTDGTQERLDSPEYRLLRKPNPYQSRADFFLYFVSSIIGEGNGYARAFGGDRVPEALFPYAPGGVVPQVDPQTGALFYDTATTSLNVSFAPAQVRGREMWHQRIFTDSDPLIGISLLSAAALSIQHTGTIQKNQLSFYQKGGRPNGILSTDQVVQDKEQKRMTDAWNEAYGKGRPGGTAMLDRGMKYHPLTLSAADAQTIEQMNWGIDDICRVHRVPLFLVNRMESMTFSNAEQMSRTFLIQTLGFWLSHLELSLDLFLQLPPNEHMRFDIESGLIGADFKTRVESYREGVQGGIFSPNEARRRGFGLGAKEGGDEVYLQRQMRAISDPPEAEAVEPVEPEPSEDDVEMARLRLLAGQREGELLQARAELARMREAPQ